MQKSQQVLQPLQIPWKDTGSEITGSSHQEALIPFPSLLPHFPGLTEP